MWQKRYLDERHAILQALLPQAQLAVKHSDAQDKKPSSSPSCRDSQPARHPRRSAASHPVSVASKKAAARTAKPAAYRRLRGTKEADGELSGNSS